MKTRSVFWFLIFGVPVILTGCYTQYASYDDYYTKKHDPRDHMYTQRQEEQRQDDQYADQQDTNYSDQENDQNNDAYYTDNGSNQVNYYFGGGSFPHYRRYFRYYVPSYGFSIYLGNCFGDPWWDPWFGWYDPTFPTIVYVPTWYYGYSPVYWGYHHHHHDYYTSGKVWYDNTTRLRNNGGIMRNGGQPLTFTGRDLTNLRTLNIRDRNVTTIDRGRRTSIASTANPFVTRERIGIASRSGDVQSRRDRGTAGSIGSRSGRGTIDANRGADRSRHNDGLDGRLRDREKNSRGQVFRGDRSTNGRPRETVSPRVPSSRGYDRNGNKREERKKDGATQNQRYAPAPERRNSAPSYSPAPRQQERSSAPRSSDGGSRQSSGNSGGQSRNRER
ncbi:MAG: hypothetical protein LWX56_11755 [Ignavibacteria bacterium]|nr:hypothetical protein [Ignavibacteria bacterium]